MPTRCLRRASRVAPSAWVRASDCGALAEFPAPRRARPRAADRPAQPGRDALKPKLLMHHGWPDRSTRRKTSGCKVRRPEGIDMFRLLETYEEARLLLEAKGWGIAKAAEHLSELPE